MLRNRPWDFHKSFRKRGGRNVLLSGYPPVAILLGIILGPIADAELIRAYMRFGNKFYLEFINRPISLALLVIIFISVLIPYLRTMLITQKK